jgi:hypothetical protein
MKLLLFWMVFVDVYIHFRIWIRIRNPGVTDPDPAKVQDPCGSGSISLLASTAYVIFMSCSKDLDSGDRSCILTDAGWFQTVIRQFLKFTNRLSV